MKNTSCYTGLLLTLGLLLLPACSPKSDGQQRLTDRAYVLTVREAWDHDQQAPPAAPLNYVAVSQAKEYGVVLSAGQDEVTITQAEFKEPVRGRRDRQADQLWSYRLKEGLMAGGELLIRFEGPTPQAQLDILGSGVPLISSERGPLTEQAAR